jgi:hypothetical protein
MMKKSLPALDLQDAAIIGRARGVLPSPGSASLAPNASSATTARTSSDRP